MYKRIKKRFDIPVTIEGAKHSRTFDLDKNITKIFGLLFTSDRDELFYYRGSQKVEINRQEIFPENYESKLLLSGINVSPNDRYYSLGDGLPPGNGKVTVEYQDTSTSVLPFENYRVTLYLDCEITDLE